MNIYWTCKTSDTFRIRSTHQICTLYELFVYLYAVFGARYFLSFGKTIHSSMVARNMRMCDRNSCLPPIKMFYEVLLCLTISSHFIPLEIVILCEVISLLKVITFQVNMAGGSNTVHFVHFNLFSFESFRIPKAN